MTDDTRPRTGERGHQYEALPENFCQAIRYPRESGGAGAA